MTLMRFAWGPPRPALQGRGTEGRGLTDRYGQPGVGAYGMASG